MNCRLCLSIAVAIGLSVPLFGAAETPLLYSLLAPGSAVVTGETTEVQLAVLNRSNVETTVEFPVVISGHLAGSGGRWAVSLTAPESTAPSRPTIAPGGFVLRPYRIAVPRDASTGAAVLEVQLDGVGPSRTAMAIAAAPPPSHQQIATAARRPPTNLVRAEPAAADLRTMFAARLGAHEPIYFIYGDDDPAAKFQFSFKYKLLDFERIGPQRMARTLQFGYTQRSLWDIGGESSPFYDTSYMPEIIYQSLAPKPETKQGWFTWLGFQAAFKHESNGRDGPISRSLNLIYARPVFALGPLDGWHLLAMPELFTYVGSKDENPDIADYRSYGKLQLVLGRNDGAALMASLWAGKDFQRRSLQLDLTVPIRTKLLNFETYLLIQYFDGYGESLRSHQEKSERARAGISLVR